MNAEIYFVSFDIKNIAASYATKIIREEFLNLDNIQGEILKLCWIILNGLPPHTHTLTLGSSNGSVILQYFQKWFLQYSDFNYM